MPGIDFAAVRDSVSLLDVLQLLDLHPIRRRGNRLRGPCPFGCNTSPRDFAGYLETDRYYCFCCHRGGNQLELWADVQRLRLFEAARDLCHRLNIEVPVIYRW
jgi:DNA primase